MTQEEQFAQIVKKEQGKELITFLKSLDAKQKKSFAPFLKKTTKDYLEFKPFGSTYKRTATPAQLKILGITAFVCLNKSDFEKAYGIGYMLGKEEVDQILAWYCPSWFNDHINGYASQEYIPQEVSYDWVMDLSERGFITPTRELIAKTLPEMIYERSDKHEWSYIPQNLTKRTITLQEHLWYVFEIESNIHWSDRFLNFAKGKEQKGSCWLNAINTYTAAGKIDRQRLLKESLLATTRGFNKVLSGWLADLFIQLQPTKEELLELQNELFQSFNSAHSKPVNTALKFLKGITTEKGFDATGFLENAALLLASETKTTVSSTLMILDALAKKYPQKRETICELACQALVPTDDALQTRAAKLIQKWGTPAAEQLQEIIEQYYENLFSTPKGILQSFVTAEVSTPAPQQETTEVITALDNATEIHPIESFDDLLYLASQVFDNNEPYHFDLLIAALVTLQDQIKGDAIAKLEPAFLRAYKLLLGEWPAGMGNLDHLLATFFIDYGMFLSASYPEDAGSIRKLHEKNTKLDKDNGGRWQWYKLRIRPLAEWKSQTNCTSYEPHKQLLLAALKKLKTHDSLPLLSTPTYTNGRISPVAVVNRLQQYQKASSVPNDIDLQIAIARCVIDNSEEALTVVEEGLTGEFKALMRFLLIPDQAPQPPFTLSSAWMMAGVTKAPYSVYQEFSGFSYAALPRQCFTAEYPGSAFIEKYTTNRYDVQTRKEVKVEATNKVFKVDLRAGKKENSLFSTLTSILKPQKKDPALIYEYLHIKAQYIHAEHNDIRRLLMLTPHNPGPLLAQVMNKSLKYSSFWEEGDRKLVTNAVEALFELWGSFGYTAHLFVSNCLLSSDKTVRTYAAEIWIRGVNTYSIDSTLIGELIGMLEKIEFAPLKRFTDLIISNMFQISPLHNAELEKLLAAILLQLPDEPIKNLKKLLEIYLEIVGLNNSVPSHQLLSATSFKAWKSSSGLSKILKAMEERTTLQQA